MTHATHAARRLVTVIPVTLALALAAAACSGSAASPSTSVVSTPAAAPTAASPAATAAASAGASSAAASPSSATACTTSSKTTLPSDRLTNVTVTPGATSDRVDFVFGQSSLPGPASPPMGSLEIATPPYTHAGSGAPIDMGADSVVQLVFTGMSLQNDAGEEMFTGPTELTPNLPALRKAAQFDASEGTIGWYIGYDNASCVVLGSDQDTVTVTIDHL
jgi:hypothetical protein